MEIYKLGDEILEGRRGELRITDLKQGVKNENRVNVYVNGDYAFSLDIAQVVELSVKVGRILTENELEELKKASEFGKAYQRALEWALMRPRSMRELRDYLRRRGMQMEMKEKKKEWEMEREIRDLAAKGEEANAQRLKKKLAQARKRVQYDFDDLIIERLCARGYVDDWKFAKYYVENRLTKKGVSQKRLRMELQKKGVPAEIIEEVLGGRDDETEIRKMILRKRAKYDDTKLTAYLCRQGFPYDLVQRLVEESRE